MSVQAIAWALSQNVEDRGERLLLILLANRANPEGRCWPSVDLLARELFASSRTTWRLLARLERAGYLHRLERYRDDGARTTSMFVLRMGEVRLAAPSEDPDIDGTMPPSDMDDSDPPDASGPAPPANTVAGHEPSLEPSSNTHTAAGAARELSPFGTVGEFSESDFLSDDGKVRVSAVEIAELEQDLPALKNVRGHMRQGFRIFAHKPPGERLRAVRFYLMKKDDEAASRDADLDKRRATRAKEKKNGGGVPGLDSF